MRTTTTEAPDATASVLGTGSMLFRQQLPYAEASPSVDGVFDGVASTGLLCGLQEMGQAAIILDQAGFVIGMNSLGEEQIGHVIILRSGRLSATSHKGEVRLQRLIRRVSKTPVDPDLIAVLPSGDGRQLIVRGTQIATPGPDVFSRAKVLLTLTEVRKASVAHGAILRDMFGLTACEANIALAIANADDPRTIAAGKNISIDTVRSHLKAIFGKTDTRRQVELAILVTRLNDILSQDPIRAANNQLTDAPGAGVR